MSLPFRSLRLRLACMVLASSAFGCGSGSTAPRAAATSPPPATPRQATDPVIARTNPAADGEAYVGGHVERPGAYPLSADRPLTLRSALATAGADYDRPGGFRVELVRRAADGREVAYEIGEATLRSATGDTPLQPGDQVFLVGVKWAGTGVGVDAVRTPDCFPPAAGVRRLP